MRICWVSNSPKNKSGYGQQSAIAVRSLMELGHHVIFFTNYREGTEADGTLPYPVYSASSVAPRAYDGLAEIIDREEIDVVIILADAWVFGRIQGVQELERVRRPLVRVFMSPVDCLYLSPLDADVLSHMDILLAMSPHAQIQFQNSLPDIASHYLPHAVDTNIFKIDESVKTMWEDHLVIGMVQANAGTRKQIPQQLEAISMLREKIPKMVLMLYMDVDGSILENPHAINYKPLIEFLGIEDMVMTPPHLDATSEDMATLYNRFDLLLNTSSGEGFGIPIVEALACGIQPVVTRNSAMQYFNACIQVEPCINEYASHLLSYFSIPHPKDIANMVYNWYIGDRTNREVLREQALPFDKDHIRDHHWVPVLEEVAKKIP